MTIWGYLIKKRMSGKTLLQTTGLSVSEVAMESGYDNFSYFIRVFRQYFGVTPKNSSAEKANKDVKPETGNGIFGKMILI